MSDAPTLSRRFFLTFGRSAARGRPSVPARAAPAPAPAPQAKPGFSLEGFYRSRQADGTANGTDVPRFSPRDGLPAVAEHLTRRGVPEFAAKPGGVPSSAPVAAPAFEGVARVRTSTCLAWQGSFCSVCVERCPVEGAIVEELGRPSMVENKCTGCGLCIQLCPAPINALQQVPRASRSAPSAPETRP
jgi:ferredoxin